MSQAHPRMNNHTPSATQNCDALRGRRENPGKGTLLRLDSTQYVRGPLGGPLGDSPIEASCTGPDVMEDSVRARVLQIRHAQALIEIHSDLGSAHAGEGEAVARTPHNVSVGLR